VIAGAAMASSSISMVANALRRAPLQARAGLTASALAGARTPAAEQPELGSAGV